MQQVGTHDEAARSKHQHLVNNPHHLLHAKS